mgnify:CR=1 FL=1
MADAAAAEAAKAAEAAAREAAALDKTTALEQQAARFEEELRASEQAHAEQSARIQADIRALEKQKAETEAAKEQNLDDMAQSILMNLQKGEIDRSVRLAPHTNSQIEGLVPRIVPLRWVPEQEIHTVLVPYTCIAYLQILVQWYS